MLNNILPIKQIGSRARVALYEGGKFVHAPLNVGTSGLALLGLVTVNDILEYLGLSEAISFVADGDGSGGGTEISSALNTAVTALSTAGGGEIYIPRWGTGIYLLAGTVEQKSNVTIRVAPGVTFDRDGTDANFLAFTGSAGSEINTSANLTRGDTEISTTTAHGLAEGDYVQIMGQRNALCSDAGVWRCGDGTGSLPEAYFTEWLRVAEVIDTDTFRSDVPLIFPDYRIDDDEESTVLTLTGSVTVVAGETITQATSGATGVVVDDGDLTDDSLRVNTVTGTFDETNQLSGSTSGALGANSVPTDVAAETSRTRTTIRKITPVQNAHWFGGEFICTTGTNSTDKSPVIGKYAVNCTFQDAVIDKGAALGPAVCWVGSYKCKGKNIRIKADHTIEWDYATMHGSMNRFRVVSSQDCGFDDDCYNEYDAQPVDFTYSSHGVADLAVCVRPYYNYSTTDHCFEAATSHPGVFQEEWIGNKFLNCLNGAVLSRGLQPRIRGNKATSTTEGVAVADPTRGSLPSIAFDLYAGHSKGADIGGNDIDGFRYSFGVRDEAGDPEGEFSTVDAFIHGNNIRNCFGALYDGFNVGNVADRNIVYQDNAHHNMGGDVISWTETGCTYYNNTEDGAPLDFAAQTIEIASGVVSYNSRNRLIRLNLNTEASAATDDLDRIVPLDGARDGDVIIIRQVSSSRDITIRDIATSSAATDGFQLPGNTSINLATSAATAMFVRSSTQWLLVSSSLN